MKQRNAARMPKVTKPIRELKGKTPTNPDKPIGYGNPPKETQIQPGQVLNPKGRPRTLSALRELIQDMGNEKLGQTELTRLEVLLRGMYSAKNSSDKTAILEYGWGKVTQPVEVFDWRVEAEKAGYDATQLYTEFVNAARRYAALDAGGDDRSPASGEADGE